MNTKASLINQEKSRSFLSLEKILLSEQKLLQMHKPDMSFCMLANINHKETVSKILLLLVAIYSMENKSIWIQNYIFTLSLSF
jgi:hypothetical protein